MSLLSIIQNATDLLSVPRPAAVVSSTDQQVRQLYALANLEGAELATRPQQGWQALQQEQTFITIAAETQVSAVPTNFGFALPDTAFNRTTATKLVGPLTPEDWQANKALNVVSVATNLFRVRGSAFLITPAPTAGETIAYEFSSSYWAKSSAGVAKIQFSADEDGTYLPEDLITQGVIWRFKQAKGLDYGEDMETYERNLQLAIGRDGGKMALSLSNRHRDDWPLNIPQTGIGI